MVTVLNETDLSLTLPVMLGKGIRRKPCSTRQLECLSTTLCITLTFTVHHQSHTFLYFSVILIIYVSSRWVKQTDKCHSVFSHLSCLPHAHWCISSTNVSLSSKSGEKVLLSHLNFTLFLDPLQKKGSYNC